MAGDFPLPRVQFPRVDVTPQEHQARKAQMERMLANGISEYERLRATGKHVVDAKRWKLVEAKDSLRLFRERHVRASRRATNASSYVSDDDAASQASHGRWEDIPYEAVSAAALTEGRHHIKSMLLIGDIQGRMENAIYAVVTKSDADLALVDSYLHDDVADCAILNTMEGPTAENPLHFLGYKWFVKKGPGGGRIVKHRDVVYLESCGIKTTASGEEIGFLLMESVDLPGFPEMSNRHCIRAAHSVCILVRQKTDNVVEVFLTGVVEPSGKIRRLSSMLTAQTLFVVTRVMGLAECKRLTKMLVGQSHNHAHDANRSGSACSLCNQKRKFLLGISLSNCNLCSRVICSRCQIHKRVFLSDGVLGSFHRVGCCKRCVLVATSPIRAKPDQALVKTSASVPRPRYPSKRDSERTDSSSNSRPRLSSDSDLHDIARHLESVLHEAIEEEKLVPRGTVDSPGITLLPDALASSFVRPARATTSSALVSVTQTQRSRFGRSESLAVSALPEPPTFSMSAPGGTYNLRTAPERMQRTPSSGSSQEELFARMMELRRVAESTYHTTQQNRRMMQHQSIVPRKAGSGDRF